MNYPALIKVQCKTRSTHTRDTRAAPTTDGELRPTADCEFGLGPLRLTWLRRCRSGCVHARGKGAAAAAHSARSKPVRPLGNEVTRDSLCPTYLYVLRTCTTLVHVCYIYFELKTRSLNNRPTTFIMSARVWTLIWTATQFRRRPNLLPPGARTNYHVRVKISKWSLDKRHVDMWIFAELCTITLNFEFLCPSHRVRIKGFCIIENWHWCKAIKVSRS